MPSDSEYDASSGTRRRSDELLEWPRAFCSRKATSFAGETRLLGRASSSMVFPREREDGGAFSVRFRRDIEVKLRSRRFYCEVQRGLCAEGHARCVTCGSSHGLSRRLGTPLACCTGWAEGLEAIHPYSRVVLVWYVRGERGSYVGRNKQTGKQASKQASYPNRQRHRAYS